MLGFCPNVQIYTHYKVSLSIYTLTISQQPDDAQIECINIEIQQAGLNHSSLRQGFAQVEVLDYQIFLLQGAKHCQHDMWIGSKSSCHHLVQCLCCLLGVSPFQEATYQYCESLLCGLRPHVLHPGSAISQFNKERSSTFKGRVLQRDDAPSAARSFFGTGKVDGS